MPWYERESTIRPREAAGSIHCIMQFFWMAAFSEARKARA